MREIVFDTETTGLDCLNGDRLIEIGCVELLNHIPTGRTFHPYINPRRPVAYEAVARARADRRVPARPAVLRGRSSDEFAEFVGDSVLVAHNAGFDRGFINMELSALRSRASLASIASSTRWCWRAGAIRTRRTASTRSAPATASTLAPAPSTARCIDAKILAEVYLELMGGRQASLSLAALTQTAAAITSIGVVRMRPRPLLPRLTVEDERAHQAFVTTLGGDPRMAALSRTPHSRPSTRKYLSSAARAPVAAGRPARPCAADRARRNPPGRSSAAGKPPWRVASATIWRAKGKSSRGHSIRSRAGCAPAARCGSGTGPHRSPRR